MDVSLVFLFPGCLVAYGCKCHLLDAFRFNSSTVPNLLAVICVNVCSVCLTTPKLFLFFPYFAWLFHHFSCFQLQLSLPTAMVFHFVLAYVHVWLHVDFLGCCFHFVLILCMLVCLMRFFFCCMHVGFVSGWMILIFQNVEYCLCCFHFLYVDFFCRKGVFVSCMLSFILQIWNVVWFAACLVDNDCFWMVLVICCLWMFAYFLLQTCFLCLSHFATTLLPLFACFVLHFCMFTCIWVCQLLILEACNIVWFLYVWLVMDVFSWCYHVVFVFCMLISFSRSILLSHSSIIRKILFNHVFSFMVQNWFLAL